MIAVLNVRADYEKSVITGCDNSRDMAVVEGAYLGHAAYKRGEHHVPILFASVQDLKTAWLTGWFEAQSFEEIDSCSNCQAAHGDPCPYHD